MFAIANMNFAIVKLQLSQRPETGLVITSEAVFAQLGPDSKKEFQTYCHSKWIILRSLLDELVAINKVFLSTQKNPPPLSLF